jgi:hypothetical protein
MVDWLGDRGDSYFDCWPNHCRLVRDDVMAFKPNEVFWNPKTFQEAQRCRCKFHSDALGIDVWCDTSWKREDEGLGSDRYEVKATASSTLYCQDHLGATDDKTIPKAAWDGAASNVTWDFFPTI